MRFNRARTGNYGRADRADETARNVVLPDACALLRRLGASGYAGRKARSRTRSGTRNLISQGAASAFKDCLWDGHGWDSVDRTACAGIPEDGFAGDDADGGDSVGDRASERNAGYEGRDRGGGGGGVCGYCRGFGGPVEGCWRARAC